MAVTQLRTLAEILRQGVRVKYKPKHLSTTRHETNEVTGLLTGPDQKAGLQKSHRRSMRSIYENLPNTDCLSVFTMIKHKDQIITAESYTTN